MTFDNELTLIKITYGKDDLKNQIPVGVIKRDILCSVKSVTRSEFYDAAVSELKPEKVFVINKYDYEGETKVEFEGVRYEVIRDYNDPSPELKRSFRRRTNSDEIELVCAKVIADG